MSAEQNAENQRQITVTPDSMDQWAEDAMTQGIPVDRYVYGVLRAALDEPLTVGYSHHHDHDWETSDGIQCCWCGAWLEGDVVRDDPSSPPVVGGQR